MMELVFVALALFIGLIFCWLVLPSGTEAVEIPYETETAGPTTAQQLV